MASQPKNSRKGHGATDTLARAFRLHLDQIVEDLETGKQRELDDDLPGGGQYECVHCSRLFSQQNVLDAHWRSKSHKKRLKELKTKPYTLEEANAAGGCGSNDFYSRQPTITIMK